MFVSCVCFPCCCCICSALVMDSSAEGEALAMLLVRRTNAAFFLSSLYLCHGEFLCSSCLCSRACVPSSPQTLCNPGHAMSRLDNLRLVDFPTPRYATRFMCPPNLAAISNQVRSAQPKLPQRGRKLGGRHRQGHRTGVPVDRAMGGCEPSPDRPAARAGRVGRGSAGVGGAGSRGGAGGRSAVRFGCRRR